jgi:hypothetical protein
MTTQSVAVTPLDATAKTEEKENELIRVLGLRSKAKIFRQALVCCVY